jgi:hypothetical protein
MSESDGGPTGMPNWKRGIRLRILFGILVAALMIRVVVGLDPRSPGSGYPLDSCITKSAVLEFLDGKSVQAAGSTDAAGRKIEMITLHKEKISYLRIGADDSNTIEVWFELDHEGKPFLVKGWIYFNTSDSPELHYHSWGPFAGQVVSSR